MMSTPGLTDRAALAGAPGQSISGDEVMVRSGPDGALYLRSGRALAPVARSLVHIFDETTRRWPERAFLKLRSPEPGAWQSLTYADAQRQSRGIAQWLIDQAIAPGGVIAILSPPSFEHAAIMIGAMRVQVASAPLAPAYSLLAHDFSKLIGCIEKANAKIAYVDDAAAFAPAIRALAGHGVKFIIGSGTVEGVECTPYSEVIRSVPGPEVDRLTDAIMPETVARIMFTSGSTGTPKAVPLTQANFTVTIAQCEAIGLLELGSEQPQFLESMPYNHIMGGNYNFANMIRLGAAVHLDEGKPTPAMFGKTLENLRSLSPHIFHTVPAGHSMLCDALEKDEALAERFFKNLVYFGSGGATLPISVTQRLMALSRKYAGREIPIFGFYGATEFSLGTVRYWPGPMEVIGLPLPGMEMKLVPEGAKLELRIKSATVLPNTGYLGNPELTPRVFDEEGFFRSGDAVRFYDSAQPHLGLMFDGRLAEEFKLQTGTWVSVGILRSDLLSATMPLIQEAVICGLDMQHVAALLWINQDVAQSLIGGEAILPAEDLLREPCVVQAVADAVRRYNADNTGSSRYIRTARLMVAPLSAAQGELTDKGSVNQQRVRDLRRPDIEALYSATDPDMLRF